MRLKLSVAKVNELINSKIHNCGLCFLPWKHTKLSWKASLYFHIRGWPGYFGSGHAGLVVKNFLWKFCGPQPMAIWSVTCPAQSNKWHFALNLCLSRPLLFHLPHILDLVIVVWIQNCYTLGDLGLSAAFSKGLHRGRGVQKREDSVMIPKFCLT